MEHTHACTLMNNTSRDITAHPPTVTTQPQVHSTCMHWYSSWYTSSLAADSLVSPDHSTSLCHHLPMSPTLSAPLRLSPLPLHRSSPHVTSTGQSQWAAPWPWLTSQWPWWTSRTWPTWSSGPSTSQRWAVLLYHVHPPLIHGSWWCGGRDCWTGLCFSQRPPLAQPCLPPTLWPRTSVISWSAFSLWRTGRLHMRRIHFSASPSSAHRRSGRTSWPACWQSAGEGDHRAVFAGALWPRRGDDRRHSGAEHVAINWTRRGLPSWTRSRSNASKLSCRRWRWNWDALPLRAWLANCTSFCCTRKEVSLRYYAVVHDVVVSICAPMQWVVAPACAKHL